MSTRAMRLASLAASRNRRAAASAGSGGVAPAAARPGRRFAAANAARARRLRIPRPGSPRARKRLGAPAATADRDELPPGATPPDPRWPPQTPVATGRQGGEPHRACRHGVDTTFRRLDPRWGGTSRRPRWTAHAFVAAAHGFRQAEMMLYRAAAQIPGSALRGNDAGHALQAEGERWCAARGSRIPPRWRPCSRPSPSGS